MKMLCTWATDWPGGADRARTPMIHKNRAVSVNHIKWDSSYKNIAGNLFKQCIHMFSDGFHQGQLKLPATYNKK